MKNMRSIAFLIIALTFFLSGTSVFSFSENDIIDVLPPEFDESQLTNLGYNLNDTDVLNVLSQFASDTSGLESIAESFLSKYATMPKLAKGFANANAYSSFAASQRFNSKGKFALTAGCMLAAHSPSSDLNYYSDMSDEIEEGDIEAGLAFNPLSLQFTMDTSFLLEGLRMSLVVGKLNLELDNASMHLRSDSSTFGLLGTYQLMKRKELPLNMIGRGGLVLTSGCVYHSSALKLYKSFDPFTADQPVQLGSTVYSGYVTLNPSVYFNVDTSALVIPVELMTSINILGINIAAGGGFDFVSGSSDISLGATGTASVTSTLGTLTLPGEVTISSETKDKSPDPIRTKLMLDIGFILGPVMVDIPLTWHVSQGASLGVTSGIKF